MNKLLSETYSCLWSEGREPVKEVLLMLPEAHAETGSCFSKPLAIPVMKSYGEWNSHKTQNGILRAHSIASPVST